MQCLELAVPNFDGAFIFVCGVISVRNGLICVFVKKLLFYRATNFNVNKVRMQKFHCNLFFSESAFCFAVTNNSWHSRERGETIFILFYHFDLATNIDKLVLWNGWPIKSINFLMAEVPIM